MSTRLGVLKGNKINRSHSTLIESAEIVVMTAKKQVQVTKVVLGPIKSLRSGKRRLKIFFIPAGLEIMVRGGSEVQKLYVYTHVPEVVSKAIITAWEQKWK